MADGTDTSGAVKSITQYDAWGNEQAVSGTPTDPFGYNAQSGYYLDRETGVYLCQHRFYDPANGVWLNRDPIGYGGGTNLYGYCAGGPINWVDPSGFGISSLDANPQNVALAAAIFAELNGGGDIPDEMGGALEPIAERVCAIVEDVGAGATNAVANSGGGGSPLYRLVEPGEEAALAANGGVAELPQGGLESKYFWQTLEQLRTYQARLPAWYGDRPFMVWQWPNPAGLGAPGPGVDRVPGFPCIIPGGQLPGLPPGFQVP